MEVDSRTCLQCKLSFKYKCVVALHSDEAYTECCNIRQGGDCDIQNDPVIDKTKNSEETILISSSFLSYSLLKLLFFFI